MEKNLKKILQTITNSPDNFIDQLAKTEQIVYKKVLELVKGLDINSSGNIKPSIANLKKLNEIKTQLSKSLLSKQYLNSVKEYVRQFQMIANLQNESFGVKKTISKTLTKSAIENTLESLTGKGYTDTVLSKLRDIIKTSITSGGSYRDLTSNLEKQIISTDDKSSIIKKQVQTPVVDALSVFSAEHTRLITKDLGLEWFRYVGSNITTTREFCEHMTKKEYIHVSELETIVTGLIDEHQCKLNQYGLPLGMYENTNAENLQINRGGYQCRHQMYPVSREQVPIHIRAKYEKDIKL